MKVILLQDIAKIGRKFDVKEVPNGYATHLIKIGRAELATPKKVAHITKIKQVQQSTQEHKHDEMKQVIARLKEGGLAVNAKANDEGTLFESITAAKIKESIARIAGELPVENIMLEQPIKEVGEHIVALSDGENTTQITVVVSAEK